MFVVVSRTSQANETRFAFSSTLICLCWPRLRCPPFRRSMRPGGRATPSHAPQAEAARSVSNTSRLSLPASSPLQGLAAAGAPAARVAPCLSDEETGRKTNVNPSYRRGLRSAAVTNVNSRLTAGPRYGTSARAPLCGQALGKLAGVAEPAPRAEPFASFLSQVCFDRACAMGTIGCDPWAASARSSVQKGSQTLPRRPVRRSRSWQHCNSEQL